jgi:hypothetical protein
MLAHMRCLSDIVLQEHAFDPSAVRHSFARLSWVFSLSLPSRQVGDMTQEVHVICELAGISQPCLKLYMWAKLFSLRPNPSQTNTTRMAKLGGKDGTKLPDLWQDQEPLVAEDKAQEVRPFVQFAVKNAFHYVLRDAWRTAVTKKLADADSMTAVTELVMTMKAMPKTA